MTCCENVIMARSAALLLGLLFCSVAFAAHGELLGTASLKLIRERMMKASPIVLAASSPLAGEKRAPATQRSPCLNRLVQTVIGFGARNGIRGGEEFVVARLQYKCH